jgi:hypothetical protein
MQKRKIEDGNEVKDKNHVLKLSDSELKFIEEENAEAYQQMISADDELKN